MLQSQPAGGKAAELGGQPTKSSPPENMQQEGPSLEKKQAGPIPPDNLADSEGHRGSRQSQQLPTGLPTTLPPTG